MSGLSQEAFAALMPVRQALRAAAEKQAGLFRDDARFQARALLDGAKAEADAILAAAAGEGEEAARSEAVLRSARARRQAHELVLVQRNNLRVELHRRVREAAAGLTSDPRYPALLGRLTEQCKALLGPDAKVYEGREGGVVAEAGSRRLDLTLPELAELALDKVPGVSDLWSR